MSQAIVRPRTGLSAVALFAAAALCPSLLCGQVFTQPSIIHKVQTAADRLEMTVNTSRILTLDQKIPRAQVNNPDLIDLTPLSAQQIQLHAKKTGITQVNLWNEKGEIHSIDVMIYGDVQELSRLLAVQFPEASVKVFPTANSVILKGYVDRPDHVSRMVEIAQQYYPKVINNITVGGTQQVLLHVKVMEISRTKLREFGFDFANISGGGTDFATSGISGLLGSLTRDATTGGITSVGAGPGATFTFGIVDSSNAFFGVLRAMQRNSMAKILAEPNLVTVSGRPAYFQEGGEIPILIPQGLGTVAVEFRRFGTQLDFVPIVIGNGTVRLEVRPRVSELDYSIATTLNGNTIPGFKTREVETGVELKAGQTLALAGLIQNRMETEKQGIPWLGDMPYIGAPFRRVREVVNEVELLILVRPEIAEALDPEEVPPCGPGTSTTNPSNVDLYLKGYIEVPKGYYDRQGGHGFGPGPGGVPVEELPNGQPVPNGPPVPNGIPDPAASDSARRSGTSGNQFAGSSRSQAPLRQPSSTKASPVSTTASAQPSSRRTSPSEPQSGDSTIRTAQNPSNRRSPQGSGKTAQDSSAPGLIGPVGYDVSK